MCADLGVRAPAKMDVGMPRSGGLGGMIPRAVSTDKEAIVLPDSNMFTHQVNHVASHHLVDDELSAIELHYRHYNGNTIAFPPRSPPQEESNKVRPRRRLSHKQNIRL